jgi:hypothetical protein
MTVTVLYPEDRQIPDLTLEQEVFAPEVRIVRAAKQTKRLGSGVLIDLRGDHRVLRSTAAAGAGLDGGEACRATIAAAAFMPPKRAIIALLPLARSL